MPETAMPSDSTALEQSPAGAHAPATLPAVREVLAAIWEDCVQSPAKYLSDTVVPSGGE